MGVCGFEPACYTVVSCGVVGIVDFSTDSSVAFLCILACCTLGGECCCIVSVRVSAGLLDAASSDELMVGSDAEGCE